MQGLSANNQIKRLFRILLTEPKSQRQTASSQEPDASGKRPVASSSKISIASP
jgi:hypothetical protein